MLSRKSVPGSLLALSALLWSGAAEAKIITYNIDVTVTSALNSPGSYGGSQWNFGLLPDVFSGTFTADDTLPGSISNLNLVIGGKNVTITHPYVVVNEFDPVSLILTYGIATHLSNPPESGVGFGDPLGLGAPSNYAVAAENSYITPLDTYYARTQNWVGTYSITAASVPEPSTMVMLGVGLAGLAVGGRKKRAEMA